MASSRLLKVRLLILFSFFTCFASCNNLNASYSSNFIFNVSHSPYYVDQNVVFESTADVIIENGVEIIFNGGYYIEIFGNINCGCIDGASSNTSKRGLSNITKYTYIHNSNIFCDGCGWRSSSHYGWISISNNNDTTTEVKFCNTKFDNNYIGIKWTSPQYTNTIIDHCEFNNLYYATYNNYHDSSYVNIISNTLIRNVNVVNSIGNAVYNNVFIDKYVRFCDDHPCVGVIENYAYCCSNIVIMNSMLNNSAMECLSVSGMSDNVFYNNSVANCGRCGIIIPSHTLLQISNNEFMHIRQNSGFTNAIKNYADNMLIQNNTFNGNDIDIFLSVIDASNITINNNIFSYNEQYCIAAIWGSNSGSKITIANNDFLNNGRNIIATCIIFAYSADIIDNNFVDNVVIESLIMMDSDGDVTISGNTIQSNHVNTSDFALISVSGGNLKVMYNIVTDNIMSEDQGFVIRYSGSNVSLQNNVFIDNVMEISGSIVSFMCWGGCTNYNIKYNDFYSHSSSNNIETYIDIYISSDVVSFIMQYNNFGNYHNVIYFIQFNIYKYFNVGTLNMNNNAFIWLSDINTIDSKIRDGCDAYWNIIEYSPWYADALNFENLSNLPIKYTTNFICGKTPNPTKNPTTATSNPTTANPTTSNPTTANPTTSNPTTANPTTSNPTTSNPTTANPTTSNPTTANPTTSNPTTTSPTTTSSTTTDICTMDRTYCYNLDINPSLTMTTECTQNILGTDGTSTTEDSTFYIDLSINGYDCISPTISFEYIPIDYNTNPKYINITEGDENILIGQCGKGETSNSCSSSNSYECITDKSLSIIKIDVNSIYQIKVYKSAAVRELCFPDKSLSAILTIKCGIATQPTTTTAAATTTTMDGTTTTAKLVDETTKIDDAGIGYSKFEMNIIVIIFSTVYYVFYTF